MLQAPCRFEFITLHCSKNLIQYTVGIEASFFYSFFAVRGWKTTIRSHSILYNRQYCGTAPELSSSSSNMWFMLQVNSKRDAWVKSLGQFARCWILHHFLINLFQLVNDLLLADISRWINNFLYQNNFSTSWGYINQTTSKEFIHSVLNFSLQDTMMQTNNGPLAQPA